MRRLFHALLLLGAGTLFFGCDAESKLTPNGGGSTQTGATQDSGKNDSQTGDSTQGNQSQDNQQTGTTQDNENNDSQTDDSTQDNQSQDNQPTTTTIWSGTQDFNDTEWRVNIQIPAEKFSSFEAGSKIQIEWHEPASAAEYKKLQLDYMASPWAELKGGEFSGGKTDDTAGVIPETSPLTYTVTADNAQKLKSHGLALMGYGVVVTKIAISAGSSSDNPPATPNPEDPVIEPNQPPAAQTGTPFERHGKLHVNGAYLYDEHGEKYQLYGMSTHGINFGNDFSRYVNKEALKTLRDDWNTNCIRLVLYPRDFGGYCDGGNKEELKQIMRDGIEYATELGLYALVDWHVHNYNPQETQTEAIAFLTEIAGEYAKYDNVL